MGCPVTVGTLAVGHNAHDSGTKRHSADSTVAQHLGVCEERMIFTLLSDLYVVYAVWYASRMSWHEIHIGNTQKIPQTVHTKMLVGNFDSFHLWLFIYLLAVVKHSHEKVPMLCKDPWPQPGTNAQLDDRSGRFRRHLGSRYILFS